MLCYKMNNQGQISTRQIPDILRIKPLEELAKPKAPTAKSNPVSQDSESAEIGELKRSDIFIKPQKKKKPMTEKRLAHMKMMNQKRHEKAEARKAEKEMLKQQKQQAKAPVQQVNILTQPARAPAQQARAPAQQPAFNKNQIGQAYMKEFFTNMGMFVDATTKLNTAKQQLQQSKNIQKSNIPSNTPQKKNNTNKALKKNTQSNNDTYFIDFLKPAVNYDHRNSFGL